MVDANDLVYLRARYYHPGLGVFPSLDPIENINRYQYVSANPINRVDPSGMQDALICDILFEDETDRELCNITITTGEVVLEQFIEKALEEAIKGAAYTSAGATTASTIAPLAANPWVWLAAVVAGLAYVCTRGDMLETCSTYVPYDFEQLRPPTPSTTTETTSVATATPGSQAQTAVANDPTSCPTSTNSDNREREFIYREVLAKYQRDDPIKAVTLRAPRDYFTGLSFWDEPVVELAMTTAHLKYRISTLRANGFEVRNDAIVGAINGVPGTSPDAIKAIVNDDAELTRAYSFVGMPLPPDAQANHYSVYTLNHDEWLDWFRSDFTAARRDGTVGSQNARRLFDLSEGLVPL